MEVLSPDQLNALQPQPEPQEQAAPDSAPAAAQPVDALKASPSDPFNITLDDGRVVVMQKPVRPTALHVAKCLGVDNYNDLMETYYSAMLWVKQVGSIQMPFLASKEMFEGMAEALGDDGLKSVTTEYINRKFGAGPKQKLDVEALKNA